MILTSKQREAREVLSGSATHIALGGGSRSGKTALIVRQIATRALKTPNSRHAILRFRLNAIKAAIVDDTWPKIMRLAFPRVEYELNKTDLYADFENKSRVYFAGLDDKDRVEKILGTEFVTMAFNEASQIPLASRDIALTRLAQKVTQTVGDESTLLQPRAFYDFNPPNKAHWTYRLFIEKIDPETRRALGNPQDYAYFRINPEDNQVNISPAYLAQLQAMSPRLRKRFLQGEFADATPNALFTDETIERWRVMDGTSLPEFVRVVVGVDPSGSGDIDNSDNDAIGIIVAGLGTDGNAYVLEDCTVKAGPLTWGTVVTSAYDRHEANVVVGELNYGGAMVQQTIQTARPRTPFKGVTASRGKHVRAEPFSALYETGKVRHVGEFRDLEDELTAFSTVGYTGSGSPNRADALIWTLAELFPALTRAKEAPPEEELAEMYYPTQGISWMRA